VAKDILQRLDQFLILAAILAQRVDYPLLLCDLLILAARDGLAEVGRERSELAGVSARWSFHRMWSLAESAGRMGSAGVMQW